MPVKEYFTYSNQEFKRVNGDAEMHNTFIKNGKGQEIMKVYKNGKLKSTKKRTIKPKEASKIKEQSLIIGGSCKQYKHSRSKTHKKGVSKYSS
jgi:hypothetical protein